MAEAFLRKRKDKARVPSSARPPAPAAAPAVVPRPAPAPQAAHVHEIKLFSSFGGDDRYNIIRLNSSHPVDIAKIPGPLLLNRKDLEYEQQAKTLAYDESGAIIGKYVYDNDNKPVLDAEGKHVIEVKEQADRSLMGGPDRSRKGKKGVKEVYHQDREIMRLRREETVPWVLESASVSREAAQRGEGGKLPVHWTGQYQEPSALPTVLLLNNGNENGFRVVPLGRTYKFEPDRPFKPIDVDEANRMFEQKNRGNNRWTQRDLARAGSSRTSQEHIAEMRQNQRAERFAQGLSMPAPRVKQERYEDDERREGRGLQRGMEGGADEELDYDEAQDFQDDDDVNTFYHNQDEEEEAKLQDENLKKQYRLANANVGDRPQISDLSEEESPRSRKHDKKLAKMVKKEMEYDDMFGSSDESSDEEEEKEKKEEKKEEKREEPKPEARVRHDARGATTPTMRSGSPVPKGAKSSTAPPSGSSYIAQRAASPAKKSRPSSRAGSPGSRAGSPVAPASPGPAGAKRKQSPAPAAPNERGGSAGPVTKKKKKAGSKTPTPAPEDANFAGAIQRQEVIDYFNKKQGKEAEMREVVMEFKERLKAAPSEHQGANQKLFLVLVGQITSKVGSKFVLNEAHRV